MISLPGILWGCIGSLDMVGVRGNEIADKQETVLFKTFLGSEPSLVVSRQNIRRKIQSCMDNQYLTRYYWHNSATKFDE
jgi:hypothetical protein